MMVISIEGGLITGIWGPQALDVVIIDYDDELQEEDITLVPQGDGLTAEAYVIVDKVEPLVMLRPAIQLFANRQLIEGAKRLDVRKGGANVVANRSRKEAYRMDGDPIDIRLDDSEIHPSGYEDAE